MPNKTSAVYGEYANVQGSHPIEACTLLCFPPQQFKLPPYCLKSLLSCLASIAHTQQDCDDLIQRCIHACMLDWQLRHGGITSQHNKIHPISERNGTTSTQDKRDLPPPSFPIPFCSPHFPSQSIHSCQPRLVVITLSKAYPQRHVCKTVADVGNNNFE